MAIEHISRDIARAAEVIAGGGLVAVPTETYYGLAVDPFNPHALQRLFKVKGRPEQKPILVLLGAVEDMDTVVARVPAGMAALMTRFWPGPLTLVLDAEQKVPDLITGPGATIGVRLPGCTITRQVARTFGGPITGTSANLSGHKPAASALEVAAVFGHRVDLILDGGATPGGAGSTLVGMDAQGQLVCLRQGCIPFADIV